MPSHRAGEPTLTRRRDTVIAVDSLQKIIIELQGTLLFHLHHAQDDDSFVDFSPVIDASDLGRVKAVNSLCELYMRLASAAPIKPGIESSPQVASIRQMPQIDGLAIYGSPLQFTTQNKLPASISRSNGRQDVQRTQIAWDSHDQGGQSTLAGVLSHSPPNHTTSRPDPRDPVILTPDMGSRVWTMPESPPETPPKPGMFTSHKDDTKKQKPSIFEKFRRASSKDQQMHSITETKADGHSRGSYSLSSHLWDHSEGSQTAMNPNDKSSVTERKPSDTDDAMLLELNENVWDDSHSTEATDAAVSYQPTQQTIARHPTSNLEVYKSAPELYHTPSYSPAPFHFNHTPSNPLPGLVLPSSENNYGGFCKSAWKLQVGERGGIKVRKDMGPTTSMIHVWGCVNKKCAFQCPIFGDPKHPIFDPRVHKSSSGIRFRWSFLVKSHVAQSRVVGGTYNYKCILCCSGNDTTPVFGGIDTLLKHLETHRDKPVLSVLLHNAGCVMDRFAPDEEDFDLNIVPSAHGEDPG